MILKRLMLVTLAIVGCFCFTMATQAAGEKFVIEQVSYWDTDELYVQFIIVNSTTFLGEGQARFAVSNYADETVLQTTEVNAIVAWAISNGYTGAIVGDVLNYKSTKLFNNNVSRTLNSNYTISTTRGVCVSYSVNASWSLGALISGNGSAFFEYSTDAGSTWITVNQVSKSLNLLTVAGGDDMNLVGCIPANALVRLRTTSSNMTVSYVRGQEVLN